MKRKVVAVVDNDPTLLRALERLLTAHGFDVEAFASAEAFLGAATPKSMACLVVDINLDGMSGIALRRELAASSRSLPVIFMTAFDSPATEKEATDAGCAAYLLKPFPASLLIAAIDKAAG